MKNLLKKLVVGGGIAIIGSFVFAAFAFAAASYSLFGDAFVVTGGNPGHAVQLRSIAPSGFGGIDFTGTNVATFSSLTNLSTDYNFISNSCGGGAPRFQISLTNGVNSGNVFVYLGPAPNYTNCPMNVWTNSGNLAASANLVDTSQLPGGAFYDPYSSAQAKYGTYTVTDISLVTDSGWFFNGTQTVLVDNVMINNNLYTFEPNVPTTKDQCKDGGWQNLQDANFQPFKNQGQCVSYFEHQNH